MIERGDREHPAAFPDLQPTNLLAAVWEVSPAAMALSDPDGVVLMANPAYYRLYGFTPAEVVGRSFAIIFPEEQQAQAREAYRRTFLDPVVAPAVESRVRRKDGAERLVEARYTFITAGTARLAMLSVIRDITERRRAEARLAEAAHHERTGRLASEAALRMRGQMVRFATHDLKTPLTVIKGNAQLIELQARRNAVLQPDQVLASMGEITAAVRQMEALIGDLLETSQLQVGQPLDLDRRPLDLVQLLDRQVTTWQRATTRHAIELRAAAARLVGNWDEGRLERVMDNLLSNAVKFTPGAGTVAVSVGEEQNERGRWAVVTVEDNGVGIPADDLPHVFEEFQRGSNAAQIDGTGLGLPAVRSIVEQHGGTVTAASEEGRGTAITVRLPLDGPPPT